ncbi:MAG TPA: prolyl oligopeptidase family serine peptidase [Chitinophagaceae bacterium]|nr:prolyl oligopeptidase family serine peptidase [Chitinophagaceae bacterium]
MRIWFSLPAALFLIGCSSIHQKKLLIYPDTKTVDSSDLFFGVKVPDPYRWLENDTASDTRSWIQQENKLTEGYLSQIPFRDRIRKELTKLIDYGRISAPDKEGDYYYFSKNSGLQNQSVIYRTRNPADTASAELFLDPNTFAHNGSVTLQETSFSTDGSLFAYAISMGGSDWRDVLVKDTRSGKMIGDTLKNIKFSGISWKGDDGFYYSTYDVPKGQNRLIYKTIHHSLYYHKLGTPQSRDLFIFGGEKEPHRYISGYVTEDGHYLVIDAAETTTGNELYFQDLTRKNAPIIPVVTGYASEQDIVDNDGTTMFIYTNLHAPHYRLVRVDAAAPQPAHWKDIIPETKNVLQVSTAGGYFFAQYIVDVKDQVFQYDYQGRLIREIRLPAAGTVGGFSTYRHLKDLYYTFTSFTYPATIYHFTLKDGHSNLYWKPSLIFNPDDYVTRQVFYPSKDGTKIPMYIVYKQGVRLNGKNPTYLYGYGGFNISLMPQFSALRMEWLEHGGIYAQPNLRGGGEYGQKWHLAGTLMQKQHVFDDFIAAAQYLIKEKYTSPNDLAIAGASNGGLLVGATMTERPDLMKVALPSVGVLDMLRYNKFTAGAGWASDYGTAEDSPAMFKYLLGYSPLQNVRKGVHYPATLVWTADHDDRVVPGHSFKFAATLQADNAGGNPILLQIQHNAGHGTGMDTQKEIDYMADQYAFAWYNMGFDPFK